ncbi:unnamed protein product [Urochloa decumbens]|uniref:Aluminum-activated malate transporter 1 n=1 Tax=Urochloa decumbens TaxID=240449 RepID=A0ABC9F221_9POAL
MESQTESNNNNNGVGEGNNEIQALVPRLRREPGHDRSGRPEAGVAHSLKFGLALTLVSVFYYVTPRFNSWGDSTIWAVITVLFVMEFTVGATLSKGINRVLATLTAGLLAVGVHLVARLCGEAGEPAVLAVFVFVDENSSAATFSRFIPEVKARCEYGVIIFLLTFVMVTVSSYRVENLIEYAHERVTTIMVGVATCLFTTVFVFPIWAGEDLQKLAAGNLDKLAEFLEGMESDCFGENSCDKLEGRAFLQVYKSVLNSKATEDTLCTFAKWEPAHGKFRFHHPWSQYQKIGALCRQCASSMEALASYVVASKKSQYPEANPELSMKVGAACRAISLQSSKALRELSSAVRTMTIPSPTDDDDDNMPTAIRTASDFITELSDDDAVVLQVMHVAVIASFFADIAAQTERISEAVDDLARLARFEKTDRAVVVNIENL